MKIGKTKKKAKIPAQPTNSSWACPDEIPDPGPRNDDSLYDERSGPKDIWPILSFAGTIQAEADDFQYY